MKRTQIGWVVIAIVFLVELLNVFQSTDRTSLMIVTGIMIVGLLLFGSLTIKVTDTHFIFYCGIGIIRGKYPLSDLVYCNPVSYFSLGWGIRFKPGITIFNVSGNKAVELRRKSSYQILYIGTDCPEEIARYVNAQLMKRRKMENGEWKIEN